ncbi:MAG TPA: PfkB family carbohydrate kinase [Polyangiaceae bacterium]|jgi:sugar/nucleoside kinase (ribokinase family)|nr:PfkB family carbohydrate kinase [Polyangiaceae bacterium]
MMVSSGSPILIVGSMAFDDLELPTGNVRDVVGGSATYSAFAASSFAPVRVVGVVGNDFPEATLALMRSRGIDTDGVERADGLTFRWAGRYDADLVHRVTLDTKLNVFAAFAPKIPESYKDTPFVLLGNIHPALQLDVLEQVRAPKLVVADTMNFWIAGEPKILAAMLKRIDTLVINDEEARQLSGVYNIRRAAREILSRGPKRLIIKRGEHGALLFDELGVFAAPGFPLEDVVDPTGAGDSFAGGLIGYLACQPEISEYTLRRAMIHATATASFCVEAVGTTKVASLTRADITARVALIRSLYDFGASTLL